MTVNTHCNRHNDDHRGGYSSSCAHIIGLLFAIYVDGILSRLVNNKLGCSLGNIRLGYIMYADDLILMASSLTMIQEMIKICEMEADDNIDMVFNASKSMVLRIGNHFNQTCTPVNVGGNNIPFVLKAKYLGFYICAAKFFKVS